MSGQHRAAMAPQHMSRRRADFRTWVLPYAIAAAIAALTVPAAILSAVIH